MRPFYRWLFAIVLALVLIGIAIPMYGVGVGLGGMATNSCSRLPGYAMWYLEFCWPAALLAAALAAPILILRKLRWRWVLLSLGLGLMASAGCLVLWFIYLMFAC